MTHPLSQPIRLPGGVTLGNRLAKAAMSEGLADAHNDATPGLEALYHRWAGSGAGLLLSGNFQVDRWHLERPTNVVIDDQSDLEALMQLARSGRSGGAHFWAQLSHTGRQVNIALNPEPLSASAVEIEVFRGAGFSFGKPRAMTDPDIAEAIGKFARAAEIVRDAGFTGVELHGAHGYLISQFLSPRTNLRTDRWGGSLENRARFLIETIGAVRSRVGPHFPIGVKLNASDFMKGGFSNAECIALVERLNDTSLDMIELSGGSLEQPKVVGVAVRDEGEDVVPESTRKREAYFIEFTGAVRKVAKMPIMVTGGFRTVAGMVEALEGGELDIVGLGRPMIADPDIPSRILSGEIDAAPAPERALDLFDILSWNNMQLVRLAEGEEPDLALAGEAAAAEFKPIEAQNFAKVLAARAAAVG